MHERLAVRNKQIVESYVSGKTMEEVGNIFNLTRARVQQILAFYEVPVKKMEHSFCKVCNKKLYLGTKSEYCRLHLPRRIEGTLTASFSLDKKSTDMLEELCIKLNTKKSSIVREAINYLYQKGGD